MPGNEVGDRVHNFFAQDQSQVADGSWPALANNPWAGSQRHVGLPSSNSKSYTLQQSDFERGQNSHSLQIAHGLNNGLSTSRPEVPSNHPQSQLANLNNYVPGHQILQTRHNEANFLGIGTESDRYTMTSRGLSMYDSQGGNGVENNASTLPPESSESRIGFDFLGGQQRMTSSQMGMLQLPQQLSGFNDVQLLQEQAILRKMQELQRQQLEARQQNQHPSVINGTPISPITEALNNTWAAQPSAGNKSWLHRATQAVQGSSNDFRFLPQQGQALSLMGLIPQQVDQSLYRVPVSNKGTPSQYPHVSLDKQPLQQMALYGNSSPSDKYSGHFNQANMQDGSLSSRQGLQEENFFGQSSGQGLTMGIYQGNPQPVSSVHRNAHVQELAAPSEAVQEKAELPVSSSQDAVALDPTEEKILFGDDNIWDSFGNGANMGAGGSWSALMQSAVAETSDNDIGFQEEWSGGGSIQNSEIVPLSDNANISKSYQGIPGFPQSGPKFLNVHGDGLQMDSMNRTIQHSSEEGNKWLSRGPLQKAEGTQIYQNAAHSSDSTYRNPANSSDTVIAKSVSGSWSSQQNIPSHNSGHPYCKSNGRDNMDPPSSSGNELSRLYGNEKKLQHSGSSDQTKMMYGEMSQGVNIWKPVPGPRSNVGLDQVKSNLACSKIYREESNLNNHLKVQDSSIAQPSERKGPNTHQLNFWKHAESHISKENEQHLSKSPLVLESSINSSGNDGVKMHEMDNREKNENSSDSHHSNLSQRTTAGVSDNKVWLDGNNTRNLIGGKQKVSSQGVQKAIGQHKFQYHPMGNLDEDVESFYGRKYVTHNQSRGFLGQSKSLGQFPKTSSEMEKGHLFSNQQNKKGGDDSSARGNLSGFDPNNPVPSDKDFGIYANKAVQLSQNMLESLHNIDPSKESSYSDGSAGPVKQTQSSSHGFGLQLGFPSQLGPAQNRALPSHTAQVASSLSSAQAPPEIREKDDMWLGSAAQVQSFPPSHETSEGEFKRNEIGVTGQMNNEASQYGMLRNVSAASNSVLPFSGNHFQDEQIIGAIDRNNSHSQTRINHQDRLLSSGNASQLTDANASLGSVTAQEISMRRAPSAWIKSPGQQNIFGGQPQTKLPPSISHPNQLNNAAVLASSSQQVGGCGEGQPAKGPSHQLVPSADLAPNSSVPQGKDFFRKNQSDASPSNSSSTERDFEAFGRSLKPNNISHQSYSLLNQMRVMKSTEIDPSNRGLKRFKGPDTGVSNQLGQSSEQSAMVGDTKILSFSGAADIVGNDSASHPMNVLPQDVLEPRRDSGNHHCSNSSPSTRVDHSQISPQMAPSWFNQYGTFKNGQMLSVHDTRKYAPLKTIQQQIPLGHSSDTSPANSLMVQANVAADSNPVDSIQQPSIPTSEAIESLSSAHLLAHVVGDQGLVVASQKKRKSAATLSPWHKTVMQGSQSLHTLSVAEAKWAKEANRLIDKVVDVSEMVEDGPPGVRPKRRLVLTTQLMQQLFPPPEAANLFADAHSNYEDVACVVARLALGDACSLIPRSRSESCVPLDNANLVTDKTSERISGQRLTEVTENFIGRARELENDFMRLDKRASVVDLRIENQDLEKVSLINRFARYHGRGLTDVTPPGPQRYVNALPLSRNLPEMVHCLPL